MPDDPLDVLLHVTSLLEALDIPYFVGGSFASAAYGVVRTTLDADIIATLQPEDADRLAAKLAADFYADAEMMRDTIRQGGTFNLIHFDTMFKIDVFASSGDSFTRSEFDRARRQPLGPDPASTVNLASPEDVILAKLAWYRGGNYVSERQWQDVLGVMRVQSGALDLSYLRRWAEALEVGELLAQALEAAQSS